MLPAGDLRTLGNLPHELLADLVDGWLIVCQVCVGAECVFKQEYLLICILQGWGRKGKAQRLAAPWAILESLFSMLVGDLDG